MEKIFDPRLLEQMLKKWAIPERFDTPGLDFQLVRFSRGKFLVAPFLPMDHFLFVVRGEVHIYGLREDGGAFSVHLVGQGILLGDMEFIRRQQLPFYTEALGEVLCVALPMETYRERLHRDVKFLHTLLDSVSDKFLLFTRMGDSAQPVEQKLLTFLRDIQPDHTLHSINAGVMQLHCSRAQLQRVVRKLCQEGELEKVGKGRYRLAM